MKYLYNGKIYTDARDVDEAIAEELSKQGYNNQDVPSEALQDVWESDVEEVE